MKSCQETYAGRPPRSLGRGGGRVRPEAAKAGAGPRALALSDFSICRFSVRLYHSQPEAGSKCRRPEWNIGL